MSAVNVVFIMEFQTDLQKSLIEIPTLGRNNRTLTHNKANDTIMYTQ